MIKWTSATETAMHAFLIIGAEDGPFGRIYRTRNSWNGKNPDIQANELCRVSLITTVLASGEGEDGGN